MPDLSIVITTYNRCDVLARLLSHLERQQDRDFQVVVAMDGCSDGTEAMLRSADSSFDLKWVDTHCPGYGLAAARNMGILAAEGNAVVVLDDDSFPDVGFVAAHKSSVTPGVITGGPRNPADEDNARMRWKMQELAKLPALTPMSIPALRRAWPNAYLIENNICMLREDFIAMGLFSERVKMYGYIGQEFFARVEYLGVRYQFNHDASIVHHGEYAGDNGLTLRRKQREIRAAEIIRPSLMRPRQFDAQVAWAKARANGLDVSLPGYRANLAFAAPWRYLRRTARDFRGWLRARKADR